MRLLATLLTGLAGGALVTLGARRPWQPGEGLQVPTAPEAHASLAASLGAVILVGVLVVGVARRTGRRAAGAVVTMAAAAAAVAALTADTGWNGWRVAVLAGAVLAALAGAVGAVWGPGWAGMSSRYDAPTAPRDDPDPWRALDRGEDPTV